VGSVVAALRHLLAAAVVRRWLAAALLGQLAWCMAPIALLAAGGTMLGSVSAGARLAGLLTLATAFGSPLWGRWMDAHGIVPGLRRAGWMSAAGAALLAAGLLGRASMLLLGLLAVVLGVALAPMPAAFRALLPSLVAPAQLPQASHLDAVALEVALVGGPGLVTGVLLLWDQGAPVVLGWVAALAAAAAVVLRRLPDRPPPTGDGRRSPAPPAPVRSAVPERPNPAARSDQPSGWRVGWHPVAAGVVAAALLFGLSGGLLETAVFAEVAEIGATTAAAAGLLTLVGVGSAIGGGLAALRPPPVSARVGGLLLALHATGILLAAAAGGPLWLVAACLFAAGAPVAPVNSIGALALERHAPAGRHSTSFAAAAAALTLGAGSGQLLGGLTIDLTGPRAPFLAAALLPAALGLVLITRGLRRGPRSG
jgi:MFS family permease